MYFGLEVGLKDLFSNVANTIEGSMKSLESTASRTVETINRQFNSFSGSSIAQKIGGAVEAISANANLREIRSEFMKPLKIITADSSDFDAQMSSIKAVTASTADVMELFRQESLKAGADTSFSALQAGTGIEELAKAGIRTSDILGGGLKGALDLAVAGQISVQKSAEMSATALSVFHKEGLKISDVANIMSGAVNASKISMSNLEYTFSEAALTAANLGYSFKDTTALIGIFGKYGLEGSKAGTEMNNFLGGLIPKTTAATKAMKDLGFITEGGANLFKTAGGQFKPFGEIMDLMKGKFEGLTETQKFEKMTAIFGETGKKAGYIFSQLNSTDFEAFKKEMDKVTAADVAQERLNNFKGSMEMLQGSVDTLSINIGSQLTPSLKTLTDFVGKGVDVLNDFVQTPIGSFVAKAAIGLAGFAVAGLTAAITVVQISSALSTLSTVMGALGLTTTVAFSAFLPFIAVGAAVAGAVGFLTSSWDSFTEAMNNGTEGYGRFENSGIMAFMQKLGGAMQGLWAVWNSATSKGFTIDSKLFSGLKELGIDQFVVNIATWFVRTKAFFEGVGFAINQLKGRLQPVFDTFSKYGNMLIDIFSKSAGGFDKNTDAVGGFMNVGQKIATFILDPMVRGLELLAGWANFLMDLETRTGLLSTAWSVMQGVVGTFFDFTMMNLRILWDVFSGVFGGIYDTVTMVYKYFTDSSYSTSQLIGDTFVSQAGRILDVFLSVFRNIGLFAANILERIGMDEKANSLKGMMTKLGENSGADIIKNVGEKVGTRFESADFGAKFDNLQAKTGRLFGGGFGLPEIEQVPKQPMQQNLVSLQTPQNTQSIEYLRTAEAQSQNRATANQKAQQEAIMRNNATPQIVKHEKETKTVIQNVRLEANGRELGTFIMQQIEENAALGG